MSTEWAAGLYEGEGTATFGSRRGSRRQPSVMLAMTDKDVVERFAEVMGVGKIYLLQRPNGNWKPLWRWMTVSQHDTLRALVKLLPFLGDRRREQALRVMDYVTDSIELTPNHPNRKAS